MYSLRCTACRLLVSPARLPVRSRLPTIPSTYRRATPHRTFTQNRWLREEGKSPLGSDSKDAVETTTKTTSTTTTPDATTSTSTTTTESASFKSLDETTKDEMNTVEQRSPDEGLETNEHATATAATSNQATEVSVKVEVEREVESENADAESTTHMDDVPPNPLVDDGTEIVQDIANPPSESTGQPYASQASIARSAHVGEDTSQPITRADSTTVGYEDDGFDVDLIRQAADLTPEEEEVQRRIAAKERFELRRRAQLEPKDTIFIGNLFYDVTAEDLREQMAKYGVVLGVNIIYDSRGISKGYAYVQFDSKESAARAINALHMRIYEGRRVTVHYAQTRMNRDERPREPTDTLYIANLPFEMTDRDLQDLFKDIVGAIDVRVTVDRQTGLLLGYVHAEFLNVQTAMVAREKLAGKSLYNKRLRVDYSTSSKKIRTDFPVAV
ncbi:nucleic acid-binding protein [Aspergillus stella-maris]|uniref:nucleic acid-binding protein n=1 Tax=Aspergillus stella-maris TaxID=1810926 RepID=UPI003CCD3152